MKFSQPIGYATVDTGLLKVIEKGCYGSNESDIPKQFTVGEGIILNVEIPEERKQITLLSEVSSVGPDGINVKYKMGFDTSFIKPSIPTICG